MVRVASRTKSFTLSFYLQLSPLLSTTGLFEIHHSLDQVECYFCGIIIPSNGTLAGTHYFQLEWRKYDSTFDRAIFGLNITQTQFHFFAISTNDISYSVYHYVVGEDDTPKIAMSGFTRERQHPAQSKQLFTFGQYKSNQSPVLVMPSYAQSELNVACVIIYQTRLTTMEINQLPLVCQTSSSANIDEPMASIDKLLFFSPMASFNSTSFVDNAFYLPVFGTADGNHYIPQYPCEADECMFDSERQYPSENTTFGFPAIKIPQNYVAGNFIPFREITDTFMVAFRS